MSATFSGPGDTQLSLSYFPRDDVSLLVFTNDNWDSIVEHKLYLMRLEWSDGSSRDVKGRGMVTNDAGRKGIALAFEGRSILVELSKSAHLRVYRDRTFIVGVSLQGSAKAVLATLKCATKQMNGSSEDPFASELGARHTDDLDHPAQPIGDKGSWIMTDDYPPAAARERRGGQTIIRYDIGLDGRVSNCVVEASSGSADLDAAACGAIVRKARYRPAVDQLGRTIVSVERRTVNWTLPEATSPAPPRLTRRSAPTRVAAHAIGAG